MRVSSSVGGKDLRDRYGLRRLHPHTTLARGFFFLVNFRVRVLAPPPRFRAHHRKALRRQAALRLRQSAGVLQMERETEREREGELGIRKFGRLEAAARGVIMPDAVAAEAPPPPFDEPAPASISGCLFVALFVVSVLEPSGRDQAAPSRVMDCNW